MTRALLATPLLLAGLFFGCGAGDGSSSSAAMSGSGGTAVSGSGGAGAAGRTTTGTAGAGGTTGTGGADVRPEKPATLVSYLTGNDADSDVAPTGPAVLLMGGGTDVDAAFSWWKPYLAGGDVVVLRTSGSDGYNSYLYQDIGGCDSVETLMVTTPALAADPYVAWTIAHAEGIFMAGGDQAQYLKNWKGTPVAEAIMKAHDRGAVIGGTSAGCAVLGQFMFAAYNDTVYSEEALADPYNQYMTLEQGFLSLPLLTGMITDTHFVTRDRMGRLVGFLGRVVQDDWAPEVIGIGIDEETAIVAGPDGQGQVLGNGAAYVLRSNGKPATCEAGMPLDYADLSLTKLLPGDTVMLPAGTAAATPTSLSASGGTLTPADPY